jgi:hypothetical protein
MEPNTIEIAYVGGSCPVQGEGWIDGQPFYFRARGRGWRIEIGQSELPDIALWMDGGLYGDGPHDAGYMPVEEARALILRAGERFIAEGGYAAPVSPRSREIEMGRFQSGGDHGPLRQVQPLAVHLDWASYRFVITDEERPAIGLVAYREPSAEDLAREPELTRVEIWSVTELAGALSQDKALYWRVHEELEASAARMGVSALTQLRVRHDYAAEHGVPFHR